jgi:hypothetical protein
MDFKFFKGSFPDIVTSRREGKKDEGRKEGKRKGGRKEGGSREVMGKEGLGFSNDSAWRLGWCRAWGAGPHSFVPWGLFFLEKVLSCSRQEARLGEAPLP